MSNFMPLLVAIVGIFGGAFLYQLQKTADRRNQVKQERREIYRRYVVSHVALENQILVRGEVSVDQIIELKKLLAEIAVTAPDQVVSVTEGLAVQFLKLSKSRQQANWDLDSAENLSMIRELNRSHLSIILAMRSDTFEDTTINTTILERIVPIIRQSIGKLPL